MSCQLIRNEKGSIVEVLTPQGESSQLFKAIHGNVYMGGTELSVKALSSTYTDQIQKMFPPGSKYTYSTGEPVLYYKDLLGNVRESLEETVLFGPDGTVSAGFKNPKTDEFVPIFNFDTQGGPTASFLTSQIKEGVLSPARVLGKDGITRFKGKGEFTDTSVAMGLIFRTNAKNMLAAGNIRVNHLTGEIEAEFPNDLFLAETANGFEYISLEEIPNKADNYLNAAELRVAYKIIKGEIQPYRNTPKPIATFSENEISQALMNFLETMGFSVSTLEAYRKRYNTAYGQDPDINAITDIANRVVAFANGQINIEDLSEETAHIAIEVYADKASIAGALATVHLTPEYAQYADYYRAKYAPFFEGIELEDQVRKEVLGKILAVEFKSRFQARNRTEEGRTLVETLKGYWESFVRYIKSKLKPSHIRQLNDLNKKIADAVIEKDVRAFKPDLSSSPAFFYSAMSRNHQNIARATRAAKRVLEDALRAESRTNPDRFALERIREDMDQYNTIESANTIVGIVDRKVAELERAIRSLKPGEMLGITEENIGLSLKDNLIPFVKEIRSSLEGLSRELEDQDPARKAKMQSTIDLINKSIDGILIREARIQPLVDQNKDLRARQIFEENYGPEQMSPEALERERRKFEGNIKDYGIFGKLFGLMSESSNPVLQLIATKVQQMNAAVRMTFLDQSNDFLKNVTAKNMSKYERSIIKYDADGKPTHYVWGPKDYSRYDKAYQAKKMELLVAESGLTAEEITEKLKRQTIAEILGTEEKVASFNSALKEWTAAQQERPFLPQYYIDKEERFKKHNISLATQETIKNFSARTAEINRPHMDANGRVDKSKMTDLEKEALNRIKKEKEIIKSPFDQANNVRTGLLVVKADQLTAKQRASLTYEIPASYKGDVVVLADNMTIDMLPEDSRISYDMNTLSMAYMAERATNSTPDGISEDFLQKVKDMEAMAARGEITYQEVFDWVADNSTITFSDEYYESLGDTVSYRDVVESYLEEIEDEEQAEKILDALADIDYLTKTRKYLLKQNKKIGTTSEINVHAMDEKTRIRLLEIESEINNLKNRINLPDEYKEMLGTMTSPRISDDFLKMATEAGMASSGDVFKFALRHMTPGNRVRSEKFAQELNDLLFGQRASLSKSNNEFLEGLIESGVIAEGMTKQELYNIAVDEFAKQRLAGYFKVFEPAGFQETMDAFKEGRASISEFLENREAVSEDFPGSRFMTINPDYTWTQAIDANEYINPRYKKGEYYLQLNDQYDDDTWFEHYGISKEEYKNLPNDDISQLTATRNVEEFEFLQMYMKLREKSIANYGDTDRVNKWQRVQISKSNFEKLTSTSSVLNAKQVGQDYIRDFISDRVDEKIFGEDVVQEYAQEGSQIKVRAIPKYFQAQLEDPAMLSENMISSVLLDLKESIVYAERQKAEKDVRALIHQVERQNFIQSGASVAGKIITKAGQTSNMYAKAREYVDYHLYGIQQSRPMYFTAFGREISATKVVSRFQQFSSFANLGYNLFVDLTGATTGFLNNVIDRYSQEFYHPTSVNRANSQALSYMPGYLKEIGRLDRTSELGRILELLGVEDPVARVSESKAKRAGRIAKESGFLMSRLSNLAISPKIALATLNDYRYVDGTFVSFEQFLVRQRLDKPDTTVKEAETKWKLLENESLFDHLDLSKDVITFTDKFRERFGDQSEQAFKDIITVVSQKAQKVIMNSDAVLNDADKVAAQRDVLTNTLMQHRGWMIINLTRRFKGQFYNVSTGRVEEGHYRTVLNLLVELFRTVRGKGDVRAMWQEMQRFQKQNAKRVAVETAILGLLLLLGEAVLAGDDDDDTAIENLFQLIYLRTTSEFNSSTALGIPGSLIEASSSPIPSMSSYKLLDVTKWLPEATEVDSEGNNKLWKRIKKATVLRRMDQYSNLQEQIDAYRFYNDPTLWNLGSVGEDEGSEPMDSNPYNQAKMK